MWTGTYHQWEWPKTKRGIIGNQSHLRQHMIMVQRQYTSKKATTKKLSIYLATKWRLFGQLIVYMFIYCCCTAVAASSVRQNGWNGTIDSNKPWRYTLHLLSPSPLARASRGEAIFICETPILAGRYHHVYLYQQKKVDWLGFLV